MDVFRKLTDPNFKPNKNLMDLVLINFVRQMLIKFAFLGNLSAKFTDNFSGLWQTASAT
jgi:hypothetical protein